MIHDPERIRIHPKVNRFLPNTWAFVIAKFDQNMFITLCSYNTDTLHTNGQTDRYGEKSVMLVLGPSLAIGWS